MRGVGAMPGLWRGVAGRCARVRARGSACSRRRAHLRARAIQISAVTAFSKLSNRLRRERWGCVLCVGADEWLAPAYPVESFLSPPSLGHFTITAQIYMYIYNARDSASRGSSGRARLPRRRLRRRPALPFLFEEEEG